MKRPLLIAITAGIMLVATSCGSDPAPGPTPGSGSEVDRSSAEATAVAFANIYATGDVPAACELATAKGRSGMGVKCTARQSWSTNVVLKSDCASVPTLPGAEAHMFLFESPESAFDGGNRLRLEVEKSPAESMWSVSAATTPYPGEPYSPCLDAQPSSVDLTPAPSS